MWRARNPVSPLSVPSLSLPRGLLFYPEDEGSRVPRNTDNILPNQKIALSAVRASLGRGEWGPISWSGCSDAGLIRAFWNAWQCARFLLSANSHSADTP
jgi:hypothetical protein